MLTFIPERCANCRICSAVCSLKYVGQIKPSAAAIRLNRQGHFTDPEALFCDQCAEAHCVASCPEGALQKDAQGVVQFNEALCTSCLDCIESCSKVAYDPESRRVVICNLCGGEPLCVKWCPEKALELNSKKNGG